MRPVPAFLLAAITASPAFAQRAPEIVIPGKPGVPVYIDGVDASWGIVESDFGLDRPGMLPPTVVWRPVLVDLPANVPGYHPRTGKRPGYGRLEIVPPPDRALPPPAPSYHRSWSAGSDSGPVTEYAPYYGPEAVGIGNNSGHHHHSPKAPGPKGPPGPPHKGP